MAYQLSTLTAYQKVAGRDNSNSAAVKCHSGYERIIDPSECTEALVEANNSGINVSDLRESCQNSSSEPPGCWYYSPLRTLYFNKNTTKRTSSYSHGGNASGAAAKKQVCKPITPASSAASSAAKIASFSALRAPAQALAVWRNFSYGSRPRWPSRL